MLQILCRTSVYLETSNRNNLATLLHNHKEVRSLYFPKKKATLGFLRELQQGSLVQGGLEPPDALDRQDLGPASVLSRTDGQGADLAGRRTDEMTAFFLPR